MCYSALARMALTYPGLLSEWNKLAAVARQCDDLTFAQQTSRPWPTFWKRPPIIIY